MSARGTITLFKDIFIETDEKQVADKKKGRSEAHNQRRNECLIDRYFFYGKYSGLRYELILETLSGEFFLSVVTIPNVVNENLGRLVALKNEKPSKQHFQKKWPHLVW